MVTCSDCVWADECENVKPDGWCEDFCLSPVKRVVTYQKMSDSSQNKDNPIDCKTCKRFMNYYGDYCSGSSDIYYCRRYIKK